MARPGSSPSVAAAPRREAFIGSSAGTRSGSGCERRGTSAQPGYPTAVIVTGEAGVGKTRLVEELRQQCAAHRRRSAPPAPTSASGRSATRSSCRGSDRPDIAPGLLALRDDQRRTLARLLPELGPTNRSDLADEAAERRRLFDAVARALTVSNQPVLLVADDAQWSDDASLELIHHVVRQPFDVPVVVVLTARFEEVDPDHPLVALRDELAALDRLTELRLERLAAAATVELGRELIGRRPRPANAGDALFAESEGNPLVVTEMVRAGWDGTGPVAIEPAAASGDRQPGSVSCPSSRRRCSTRPRSSAARARQRCSATSATSRCRGSCAAWTSCGAGGS